jgi:O-antigen ligase
MIDPSRGPENAQASADSREELFRVAVELWQQSPVLGFGPGTFATVSGTGLQAHTLYGQVLAETGSLGALAFLGVVASFVLTFFEVSRVHRGVPWSSRGFAPWLSVSVFATVALLLLLGVGGHNLYRHTWLWYAAFLSVALHCVKSDVRAWQGQPSDAVALESREPFGAMALYPVASSAR